MSDEFDPLDAHLRKSHAKLTAKRKAKADDVRESKVEARHVECVRADGGESYKFTSPGRRAVPDRLDLYGVDRMLPELVAVLASHGVTRAVTSDHLRRQCEALLAAAVELTECKKPGEDATSAQAREHAKLRARGFKVNVLAHLKAKPPKQQPAAVPTDEELFE